MESSAGWDRAKRVVDLISGLSVIATMVFIALQWNEMHSGAADTHDLAVAAGKQADAAKAQSEQAAKQATETRDLAVAAEKQADRTKDLADRALMQAIATQKIAMLTQDTLTVGQRAYVTIGTKDGVVAKFIPSNQGLNQNAQLVLYFQNSGHIPAKVGWGRFPAPPLIAGGPASGIQYNSPIFLHTPPRTRNKKTGAVSEHGVEGQQTGYVAGNSVLVAPFGEISPSDLTALPAKHVSTLVMGEYQYCDELGTNIVHSFGLSYQSAPNDDLAFKLVFDSPMELMPHTSTADIEYLSPCETIAEREETKKQEKATDRVRKR